MRHLSIWGFEHLYRILESPLNMYMCTCVCAPAQVCACLCMRARIHTDIHNISGGQYLEDRLSRVNEGWQCFFKVRGGLSGH